MCSKASTSSNPSSYPIPVFISTQEELSKTTSANTRVTTAPNRSLLLPIEQDTNEHSTQRKWQTLHRAPSSIVCSATSCALVNMLYNYTLNHAVGNYSLAHLHHCRASQSWQQPSHLRRAAMEVVSRWCLRADSSAVKAGVTSHQDRPTTLILHSIPVPLTIQVTKLTLRARQAHNRYLHLHQ